MASKKRYALLVDLDRCIGCHACSVACKSEMGVPLGVWLSHVKYLEDGAYPNTTRYFLRNQCNQCSNPPCVAASGGAMIQREDGVVLIKDPKSPSLKTSMIACPYHNISFDEGRGEFVKCTFCSHRVDRGLVPACANTCPTEALAFGDLNDPDSEIRKRLKVKGKSEVLKERMGTKPNIYYAGFKNGAREKFEKLIPGHRQWTAREIEQQTSFNA
ncbi:MAG: hypothetical protein A3J27_14665 [Candidatus Tectomicrobia bacterium RIFCSPLOWO2_12_FULL_69_37]|nr:MAG: hypothetical protein A3I72_09735 [Candidatus Tectomicrobia bacterium RIFCSPLOWO2_02_FULL_70_19]OGL59428.1 MAG: hypothetical protein A3J27_14665 [Candidatus Tectomicrobia bacterium RIFCSPLOWO2_12_FULL_69_37]